MSTCVVQTVPYALDEDIAERFDDDAEKMIEALRSSDDLFLRIFEPELHNPYPIGLTLKSFHSMRVVSQAICRGIVKIVGNYFQDERLYGSLLALPPDASALVNIVKQKAYTIGSWRPDYLFHEKTCDIRVCEINARFPFNAFYASYEKNHVIANLSYLENEPLMSIEELNGIPATFQNIFNPSKSVGILKSTEEGWDVNLFKNDFNNKSSPLDVAGISAACGAEARFVNPSDLIIGPDGLLCDALGPLEQFALECKQHELLAMDRAVLTKLLTETKHINDIRTILLGHDKRMLSVLTSREIMRDYVSAEDVEVLATNVVQTFVIGVHADAVAQAKEEKERWLMKPNGGGKGIGIVFGRDCASDGEWSALLDDPTHHTFILQRLVDQHVYDIWTKSGLRKMLVVGLLHCFDDQFLGPGIFRASSLEHPIVNLAGGNGIILSPVLVASRWPLARKRSSDPLLASSPALGGCDGSDAGAGAGAGAEPRLVSSFDVDDGGHKHLRASELASMLFDFPPECRFDIAGCGEAELAACADAAFGALLRDGIALVQTDWAEDEISDAMVDLVSRIGIVNTHDGSGELDVWDVRPRALPAAGVARSHTSEEFPMHTDCSFEDPPPRFVTLFVVQDDTLGGGLSTLVDTQVLTRYLSRKALSTLHNTQFDMRVPPEFHKGHSSIRGRILSADRLWRYRADTIIRETCTEAQLAALGELDALLDNPHIILTVKLPKGSMLLLDNAKWFHGRTAIYDPDRWLKRVRFHSKPPHTPSTALALALAPDHPEVFNPFKPLLLRSDSLISAQSDFSPRDDNDGPSTPATPLTSLSTSCGGFAVDPCVPAEVDDTQQLQSWSNPPHPPNPLALSLPPRSPRVTGVLTDHANRGEYIPVMMQKMRSDPLPCSPSPSVSVSASSASRSLSSAMSPGSRTPSSGRAWRLVARAQSERDGVLTTLTKYRIVSLDEGADGGSDDVDGKDRGQSGSLAYSESVASAPALSNFEEVGEAEAEAEVEAGLAALIAMEEFND